MIRGTVLNLVAIVLTAGAGAAIFLGLGRNPGLRDMTAAATAILFASEMALVPLLLTRRAGQLAVAQAALIATLVHMMVAATFAAVVMLGHLPFGQPFMYWLLTFYWMTLIVVAAECVRAVKHALPDPVAK